MRKSLSLLIISLQFISCQKEQTVGPLGKKTIITVLEDITKKPIEGAFVSIDATMNGTTSWGSGKSSFSGVTDANGQCTIQHPSSATLELMHITHDLYCGEVAWYSTKAIIYLKHFAFLQLHSKNKPNGIYVNYSCPSLYSCDPFELKDTLTTLTAKPGTSSVWLTDRNNTILGNYTVTLSSNDTTSLSF